MSPSQRTNICACVPETFILPQSEHFIPSETQCFRVPNAIPNDSSTMMMLVALHVAAAVLDKYITTNGQDETWVLQESREREFEQA